MKIYPSYPVFYIKKFLENYNPTVILTKYQLFKIVLLFLICGFFVSFVITGLKFNNFFVSEIYFSYILNFWLSNIWILLVGVIFFIFFCTNALKGQFKNLIQFDYLPLEIDAHTEKIFAVYNKVLFVIVFLFGFIIAIPLMQLNGNKLTNLLVTITVPFLFAFLPEIFKLFKGINRVKDINRDSISDLSFRKISFNSASIGNYSYEVAKEFEFFEKISSANRINSKTSDYLAGKSSNFKGIQELFVQIKKILGKDIDHAIVNNMTFHDNTTDTINFVVSKIKDKSQDGICIHTDGDYPSIKQIVNEEFRECITLKVEDKQLNHSFLEEKFIEELTAELNKIKEAEKYDYILLLLTHVFYKSGIVLNLEKVISSIEKHGIDNIIYVIDGAQAVGNIQIEKTILDKVHFYAFCGHKWLLSTPSIGVLISNQSLIEKTKLEFKNFVKTVRAYSSFNYNKNELKSTINPNPFISLYMSLIDMNKAGIANIQKHNEALANYFINNIKFFLKEVTVINTDTKGGIVTIHSEYAISLNKFLNKWNDDTSGYLLNDGKNLIRFSFHYNMSINNVNRLLNSINEFEYKKSTENTKD